MKITIKGIPPSLNAFAGRTNSWEYRNEKKRWTALVELSAPRLPKPLDKAIVTITYYFPSRRRHDADNYCGKFLLDGLTKAGIIADDDFQHISLTVKGGYDKNDPRTEIEIEEDNR